MTTQLDDKSKVRLSLGQFWSILLAVAGATFVVGGGLHRILAEQAAMRAEFALYRGIVDMRIAAMDGLITDATVQRRETAREWAIWREQVNHTNTRQDGDIRELQTERRAGLPRVPLP